MTGWKWTLDRWTKRHGLADVLVIVLAVAIVLAIFVGGFLVVAWLHLPFIAFLLFLGGATYWMYERA